MATDLEVRDILLRNRNISDKDGTVTYDLSAGVDFSDPSVIGSTLSDIVMENDVSKWISVDNEGMILKPTYTVKVVVAENENDEIEEAVESFFDNIGTSKGLLSVARGANLEDEKRPPTIPLLLIGAFLISIYAFSTFEYFLGLAILLIFIGVIAVFVFFEGRYLDQQRDNDHTSELLAILLNHVEVKALDSS